MNPEDLRVHASVLRAMAQARKLAKEQSKDVWQFAIDMAYLMQFGTSSVDFRVWCAAGLAEVKFELSGIGSTHRTFRNVNIHQSQRSKNSPNGFRKLAVVLTEIGQKLVSDIGLWDEQIRYCPVWSESSRELRIAGQLVKHFRWEAPNQFKVLSAFESKGWRERLSSVFSVFDKVDPKKRMHDTIKNLNRRQSRQLLRFHGDGTGFGVTWRLCEHQPEFRASPSSTNTPISSLTLGRE